MFTFLLTAPQDPAPGYPRDSAQEETTPAGAGVCSAEEQGRCRRLQRLAAEASVRAEVRQKERDQQEKIFQTLQGRRGECLKWCEG